jgi:hypothetical protein
MAAPLLYYTPSNSPHDSWEAYQLIFPEETHEYVRKECGQTNPDGTLALRLAPDLGGMLVGAKPIGKRAAQFFMALRQCAQVFIRVFNRLQAQVHREVVGEGMPSRAIFLLKPDRRAVIALQRQPGRRLEFLGHSADKTCIFRMFQEKGNQGQAQARFVALGQCGNQAGRLAVQGVIRAAAAQDEIDPQHFQGACQLVSRCQSGLSHELILP